MTEAKDLTACRQHGGETLVVTLRRASSVMLRSILCWVVTHGVIDPRGECMNWLQHSAFWYTLATQL